MFNNWHLKTTFKPVIEEALDMITKGTDIHLNKIPGNPSQYEIQKLHFVEQLISLEGYYHCI